MHNISLTPDEELNILNNQIQHMECHHIELQTLTRNSSGDEIANVNFLCDDIVHALKIQ